MQRELTLDNQSLVTIRGRAAGKQEEVFFILLLRDKETDSSFPIFIGQYEYTAIRMVLENIVVSRPLTHDLFKNTLAELSAMLTKVVITDLWEDIFFANLHLDKDGQEILVDCRPSDAVALALRFGSPIFIEESLFMKVLDSEYAKGITDFVEKNRPPLQETDGYIDTGD